VNRTSRLQHFRRRTSHIARGAPFRIGLQNREPSAISVPQLEQRTGIPSRTNFEAGQSLPPRLEHDGEEIEARRAILDRSGGFARRYPIALSRLQLTTASRRPQFGPSHKFARRDAANLTR
jgi:hypothetical protein